MTLGNEKGVSVKQFNVTAALIVALPLASLVALSHADWLHSAIAAATVGLIVGIPQGIVAGFFQWLARRWRWSLVISLLAMPLLALFTTLMPMMVIEWIGSGGWVPLSAPPVKFTGLVGPQCKGSQMVRWVHARGEDGQLYRHAGNLWRPVDPRDALESDLASNPCPPVSQSSAPRMPNAVISHAAVRVSQADCGFTAHYILLSDGSVWHWQSSTAYCGVAGQTLFIMQVGLSLILGGSAWFFGVLRRLKPKH
jgi:hypothetical protein